MMIIDEAHNFRSPMIRGTRNVIDKETGEKSKVDVVLNAKGKAILEHCAKVADKVLLLTATPFVNNIYDIENLMAMIYGREPLNNSTFVDMSSSPASRNDYFRCMISKFELPISEFFPEKRESIYPIYMDDEFEKAYNTLESNSNPQITAYYNGVRKLTNSTGGVNNIKVNFAINQIYKGGKTVVYSEFIDTGIALLKQRLNGVDKRGKILLDKKGKQLPRIEFAEITGRQNAIAKEISKNRFNHFVPDSDSYAKQVKKMLGIDVNNKDDYNVNVLLITKASAEGVDLIGTTNMILIDGAWNESTIQQIIARAVRFKSHTHLNKKDRYVNVFRLLLVKQTDKKLMDKISAGKFPDWGILYKQIIVEDKERRKLKKQMKMKTRKKPLQEATIIRNISKAKK